MANNYLTKFVLTICFLINVAFVYSKETIGTDPFLVWNNGPLVNSPGTGFNGADESVVQSDWVMDSYGFECIAQERKSIADGFSLSGETPIDTIIVFGYQTGSTTESTITGVYLRIYDGKPDEGGVVIWGDLTTNRLAKSYWSGIYRVKADESGNTDRPVMTCFCPVSVTLGAGDYWLEVSMSGTLAGGPYYPPITINMVSTTGDGLTFAHNAWSPALDNGVGEQQGFPFIMKKSDRTSPTTICNSKNIQLHDDGTYELSRREIRSLAEGTTDNAYDFDDLEVTVSRTSFDCSKVGKDIKAKVTVTDPSGNSSSCYSDITVHPPQNFISGEAEDVEVHVEAGICETEIAYPEFITSACATFVQKAGLGPDTLFPVGTTTEEWLLISVGGDTTEVVFDVIVSAENAMPTINNIEDIVANEDTNIGVDLSGITYGNDCLEQSITIEATGINANLVEAFTTSYNETDSIGLLTINLAQDAYGTEEVTLTVTDSEGGQASTTFNLEVTPINDGPFVVNPTEDLSVNAAKTLELPLSSVMGELFDDVDDDELQISIALVDVDTIPTWTVFENDTLVATPMLGDMGTYNFVVTATDTSMATATDTFMIEVLGYPTGIEDINTESFNVQIFPNPTKGLVKIDLGETNRVTTRVSILNISGKELLRKEFNPGESIELNLSDKMSGIYLVTVTNDRSTVVKKLILDKK